MSILPESNIATTGQAERIIPRAEEWAWDFDRREFKTKGGRMYKVYDDEAIRVWLWKLFLTERFEWLIHSDKYGGEHHTLIGRGYTPGYINSVAEQMTEEAIERNLGDYIPSIHRVSPDVPIVTFAKGILYITFYANTIYNEEVEFNVLYNTIT